MIIDYSGCSLESLYQMQSERELALDRHREKEPSTKRKHTKEHELWVAVTHTYLEDIRKIREEIVKKKKIQGEL